VLLWRWDVVGIRLGRVWCIALPFVFVERLPAGEGRNDAKASSVGLVLANESGGLKDREDVGERGVIVRKAGEFEFARLPSEDPAAVSLAPQRSEGDAERQARRFLGIE
jgi:hypothetical protein